MSRRIAGGSWPHSLRRAPRQGLPTSGLSSRSAVRSCLRELTPSFAKTFRRCHSTVRALMNSCAPICRIRQAVPRQPGDVLLLRRELGAGLGAAGAHLLPRRDQFAAGALGKRLHSNSGEHLVGRTKLLARAATARLEPQPPPVEQMPAASSGRSPVGRTARLPRDRGRSAFSPSLSTPANAPPCQAPSPSPAGRPSSPQVGRARWRNVLLADACRRLDELGSAHIDRVGIDVDRGHLPR